jgi:hypothetical protein
VGVIMEIGIKRIAKKIGWVLIFALIFSIPCAFVVVGINFLITINDIFNYIVLCLLAGLMASLVGDWKSYRLIKYLSRKHGFEFREKR